MPKILAFPKDPQQSRRMAGGNIPGASEPAEQPPSSLAVDPLVVHTPGASESAEQPPRQWTLEALDPFQPRKNISGQSDAADLPYSHHRERTAVLVLEKPRRKAMPLNKDMILIGKGSHCDIRVEGLFVKDEQAVVMKDRLGYRIICQGGLRPVRVNGDPIQEVILQVGDVITIGTSRISFNLL